MLWRELECMPKGANKTGSIAVNNGGSVWDLRLSVPQPGLKHPRDLTEQAGAASLMLPERASPI